VCKPDRVQYYLLRGRGVIGHHPTPCRQVTAAVFTAIKDIGLCLLAQPQGSRPCPMLMFRRNCCSSQSEIWPSTSPISELFRSIVKCRAYSAPVSASLNEGVLSAVSGGWGLYGWWPTRLVPNQYHLLPYSHLSLPLMVRRSWCSISVGDLPFNLSHKRHAKYPPDLIKQIFIVRVNGLCGVRLNRNLTPLQVIWI